MYQKNGFVEIRKISRRFSNLPVQDQLIDLAQVIVQEILQRIINNIYKKELKMRRQKTFIGDDPYLLSGSFSTMAGTY